MFEFSLRVFNESVAYSRISKRDEKVCHNVNNQQHQYESYLERSDY